MSVLFSRESVYQSDNISISSNFEVVILPSEAIALLEVSLSFRKLVNILQIC